MLERQLPSKLPGVGTTIFTEMSAMAHAHGALNMSQGFPDFQPPTALQQAVTRAMADGHNQYAPMAGNVRLREWIAQEIESRTGTVYDVESEITVGAGASSLLFATIQALIQRGDEAMVLTPCYDLYEPAVHLAGGTVVSVPLKADSHRLDMEAIAQAWTSRTKLIIVNVPNNPSGAIWSRADLTALANFLKKKQAFLVSDEVYGPMVYDGQKQLSAADEPELVERSAIAVSFGKVLHCTGWKIGYVAAPSSMTAELRKVHQFDVFSTGAPLQAGIGAFLRSPEGSDHLHELAAFYVAKRDRFLKGLEGSKWAFTPAEGGYFQLLCYDRFDDRNDREVTRDWCQQKDGIALIPLSPFFPKGSHQSSSSYVRVCFAKGNDTLDRGVERLLRISNG